MRARLRTNNSEGTTMPYLCPTVTTGQLATQPDGLYVKLVGVDRDSPFADIMAIGVSYSPQTLNDKRARYSSDAASFAKRLFVPSGWLKSCDAFQGGEELEVREASGWFESELERDPVFQVRYCTVLLAVPKNIYQKYKNVRTSVAVNVFATRRCTGRPIFRR